MNCKTKKELHLFAIRAFSDYNVDSFDKLEVKLWEQLAKQRRRIRDEVVQQQEEEHAIATKGYEGEVIDALEYSASGLYGALGEELFRIYARRKRWEYWKANDFLLILKNGGNIEKLSYYYKNYYDELINPLLTLCFESKQTRKGTIIHVLKQGIPDFIVWEQYQFKKKPFFVEVKSNKSNLAEQQKQLFRNLSKLLLTPIYIFKINVPPNVSFKVNLEDFNK